MCRLQGVAQLLTYSIHCCVESKRTAAGGFAVLFAAQRQAGGCRWGGWWVVGVGSEIESLQDPSRLLGVFEASTHRRDLVRHTTATCLHSFFLPPFPPSSTSPALFPSTHPPSLLTVCPLCPNGRQRISTQPCLVVNPQPGRLYSMAQLFTVPQSRVLLLYLRTVCALLLR